MSKSLLKDCKNVNNMGILDPRIINNPAVYSIITTKYYLAQENNIIMNIEVMIDIKEIEVKMNENTLECIRLFFPDFTDDDFLKLDPYDYQTFIFEIGEMRNKIYNRAAKN